MNEVEYSVSKIDPKKMIDVGSYRVDPNGKTRTVQVHMHVKLLNDKSTCLVSNTRLTKFS